MNWLSLYIFQSQLLTLHIIIIYYPLKLSLLTLYIYTNNTAVSRSYSFIIVFVGPLFIAESSKQSSDNDCTQLKHSVSWCVSVTVCSLLSYPVDCISVFHSVCLLLSQLYSQYVTFSTSPCSCSQSTLNTVTPLWHCLKDCCCVMISDCW